MRKFRPILTALAILALWWQPSHARANGHFPASVNVHVQPGNDQVILLPVTFGLYISRDGGASFQWLCEEAIGYGGMFDPDYALAEDGTFFATTFTGLRVSRDGGCTWNEVGGALSQHWVEEVERGPNGDVWAITATVGMPNGVYLSTDNGVTFSPRNLQHDTAWWRSLRVSRSDPDRVYVSGYIVASTGPDGSVVPPQVLAYRSIDRGATWEELELGGIAFGDNPLLLFEAVLPDNPDVVFARVHDQDEANEALYRSTDGGQSWQRVLETQEYIKAFVIRGNGEIIAGMPKSGVFRSLDSGVTWEQRQGQPQMACLAETSTGDLLSCGHNFEPDLFTLGRSTDGGETWQKVVRFSEVREPYACPSGTVQHDTCELLKWPSTCQQFGCNGTSIQADARTIDPPPLKDGGCCNARPDAAGSTALIILVGLWLLRRSSARSRRDSGAGLRARSGT